MALHDLYGVFTPQSIQHDVATGMGVLSARENYFLRYDDSHSLAISAATIQDKRSQNLASSIACNNKVNT
jgi:hypothetical protein